MSKVFLDYSKYYDLLYRNKDYATEAQFIITKIKEFHPHAKSILNIGCGTGLHDSFFVEAGYQLTGIDLSEQMLQIAKEKNGNLGCRYDLADARHFNLGRKFDVIISLFHVLSYQTSNDDASRYFENIESHLADGGIGIFDFWFGPAVLIIKPENRTKVVESDELKITRQAVTVMDYQKNIATVEFDIEIYNKITNQNQKLHELHPMRYFFLPELELLVSSKKMKVRQHAAWMTKNQSPSEKDWAAYTIISR